MNSLRARAGGVSCFVLRLFVPSLSISVFSFFYLSLSSFLISNVCNHSLSRGSTFARAQGELGACGHELCLGAGDGVHETAADVPEQRGLGARGCRDTAEPRTRLLELAHHRRNTLAHAHSSLNVRRSRIAAVAAAIAIPIATATVFVSTATCNESKSLGAPVCDAETLLVARDPRRGRGGRGRGAGGGLEVAAEARAAGADARGEARRDGGARAHEGAAQGLEAERAHEHGGRDGRRREAAARAEGALAQRARVLHREAVKVRVAARARGPRVPRRQHQARAQSTALAAASSAAARVACDSGTAHQCCDRGRDRALPHGEICGTAVECDRAHRKERRCPVAHGPRVEPPSLKTLVAKDNRDRRWCR